jgi:hypothetical protein
MLEQWNFVLLIYALCANSTVIVFKPYRNIGSGGNIFPLTYVFIDIERHIKSFIASLCHMSLNLYCIKSYEQK